MTLQTNGTATGAPNSCSYSDLVIQRLDKLINNEQINNFAKLLFSFILEKISLVYFAKVTKFKICRDSPCNTKKYYTLSILKKCNKQGVGSCIKWKPQLRSYNSHIKNKNPTCSIVKHFVDDCNDPHLPFKYLGFLIIDVLNNVDDLSKNDTDSRLLQKENF